jgi:hypothetical protein
MRLFPILLRLLAAAILLQLPLCAAGAAVRIAFYSREWGTNFPHAFVVLKGQPDRGGAKIDTNYGFTATAISPAILWGSVDGQVESVNAGYVAHSTPHFAFDLSDEEYDRVIATVEKWRHLKQPSYNLNRQNCVFFVGDVAKTLGMVADTPANLMKKPFSYEELLLRANRSWLETRKAVVETHAPR